MLAMSKPAAPEPSASSDGPPTLALTRDVLKSGRIRDLIAQYDSDFKPLSDAELAASRAEMFPESGAPGDDVWLFGYGSLIWNPAIDYAEKRCVTVHGYHRRFCLRTHLGRGTPDLPGLVLGLDRGGCCRGVAFRIPRDRAASELEIVWRREMVTAAYRPRWLRAVGAKDDPDGPIDAIGFVINRTHDRYAGQLPEDEVAGIIAEACGFLGPCCEYLFNTVEHLRELDMPDAGLERLAQLVTARQSRRPSAALDGSVATK